MRRLVVVLLCAAIAAVPSAAWASPGSGVSGTTSSATVSTDVVIRHIVIEPGSSTGWHYHPGVVVAVVRGGTLTRQLADCSTQTSTAGQVVVERPGPEHVHIGRNLGTEPVELFVTYVVPAGEPLAIEAPDPGC